MVPAGHVGCGWSDASAAAEGLVGIVWSAAEERDALLVPLGRYFDRLVAAEGAAGWEREGRGVGSLEVVTIRMLAPGRGGCRVETGV